jgi:hypothetical protein
MRRPALLLAIALASYLLTPRVRERLMEWLRDASDVAVGTFLRLSSQFGSELTVEGRAEHEMSREQVNRDMRTRRQGKRAP